MRLADPQAYNAVKIDGDSAAATPPVAGRDPAEAPAGPGESRRAGGTGEGQRVGARARVGVGARARFTVRVKVRVGLECPAAASDEEHVARERRWLGLAL